MGWEEMWEGGCSWVRKINYYINVESPENDL